MRYRKLDPDGDYVFGGQQADFYKDVPEAVGQAVLTRLRLLRGEWFLDITEGTPLEKIVGKYTGGTYDAAIRQRILGTQGVTALIAYSSSLDADARKLSVAATVTTQYGESVKIEATL
ncbi:hypothetical protein [Cupriavidus plantarum]|uniref:hypothetical protein n=1 Tax=Cupriavidus plantarum TaxID=942865 RepID=UPI00339D76D5